MELKPGSKQTEVGVIPEEWEVLGLQQACRETITYGIVQCGPHIRDGIPYIRVSDMDEPELAVDAMLRTSKSIASKFARSTVEEGDLVYALRGKLGEVRQVRAPLAGANLTQGTARLSPNDQMASDYFIWAMRDARVARQAELEAKGTTFREITLADLRRIKLPVPPLPEQRAIAAALSDVDGLLGGLDRLIAKKRDLKQAAMQQLLTGQTRLPGFDGEWEIVHINSLLASPIQNGVFNEPSRKGVGCKLINVIDLYGCFPIQTDGLDRFAATKEEFSRFAVRNGDIFFTRSSLTADGIAQCNVYNGKDEDLIVFDCHIIRVRPDTTRVNPLFLARICGSHAARRYLVVNAKTTTMTTIDQSVIAELPIALPPLPEQTAIAEVLTEMDAELAALAQRREKTRALKQAMMQELLTGRTRLQGSPADLGNGHATAQEAHA